MEVLLIRLFDSHIPCTDTVLPVSLVDCRAAVSRPLLGPSVLGNEAGIRELESIVHPLVAKHRQTFLQSVAEDPGQKLVVLDIPLLFETQGEHDTDSIAVVSAPLQVQRARVLARPGMTEEKFQAIGARQTPDGEKRRRADFVIDTVSAQPPCCSSLLTLPSGLTNNHLA